MSAYNPAKIFAAINTNHTQYKDPNVKTYKPETSALLTTDREIQVSATSELTLLPDRCKCVVSLVSRKEQAQEAKNSVQRRLDYVLQTLHNHKIHENDILVTKILQRQNGLFNMETEVVIHFVDFNKCQAISNFLTEKLDDSVKISPPVFYHSQERLENLRRQASLTALKNAKQKAAEMARFLCAQVGQALAVREDYCNEWEGGPDVPQNMDMPTVQQRIQSATVNINVKILATFQLKSKKRRVLKE